MRTNGRDRCPASRQLQLEALERRDLLAADLPWLDPRHLTLSFVPDGTVIAGHESRLFAALDAQQPRGAWQRDVLRAFQTWAVRSNIDIGIVPDSGDPLGIAGKTQGDARFGDIRIAAQSMSAETLAISMPQGPSVSGTWGGDVLFNSAGQLAAAGTNLFSVMLHEAGHTLGLEHSPDPPSVMASHATGIWQDLSASDIATVVQRYGTRSPDLNEGSGGNGSLANATRIKYSQVSDGYNGATPLVVYGDITTLRDIDYYSIKTLTGYRGPLTIRLQSSGISLLAPRLTVFDSLGRRVAGAVSTNPTGDVLTVTLSRVAPDTTYYLRVEGATRDVFGIGRYGLAVTFDDRLTVPASAVDAVLRSRFESFRQQEIEQVFKDPDAALLNDDGYTNDTVLAATNLQSTPGLPPGAHYEVIGSLADAQDVDIYRIRSPKSNSGLPWVLIGTAEALNVNGTTPTITLLDKNGQPVPTEILLNGAGTFATQATGLQPDSRYFVRLTRSSDVAPAGNYALDLRFGQEEVIWTDFTSGQLTGTKARAAGKLFVAKAQLFQFVLSSHSAGLPSAATVDFELRNAAGHLLTRYSAAAGEVVSAPAILLIPGEYRISFTARVPAGAALDRVNLSLRGSVLSRPIGPVVEDPTLAPMYVLPTNPSLYSYPIGVISPWEYYFYLVRVAKPA